MTTETITYKPLAIILLLSFLLYGCDMENKEQPFKIFGDKTILNQMVINIKSERKERNNIYYESKIQTALYRGKTYDFQNAYVTFYTFYISYGNQVSSIRFENLMFGRDHINYIYVVKENNQVLIKYYYYEGGLKINNYKESDLTMPLDDYFKMNNITDEREQQELKDQFFNFYDPDKQSYLTMPLSNDFIEPYKKLSLNLKGASFVRPDDLKKMDLPEEELKILLDHYNNSPNNPDKQKQ